MIDQYYETEIAINKIIEQLKSIPHHTSSVFFMGESGSGKGTLINYLIRNPYLRAEVSLTGEMIIKSQRKNSDQDEQIEIGQNMTSQTTIPKQVEHKGQIYKDFPGFHDNRQEKALFSQDIINQFYIKEVFQKTLKFKIVFLTSRAGISDRGTQFLHSIRSFSKQFKDIRPILKSICLVVSKADKIILPSNVKASLQKIQNQLLQDLTQNQKLLLRHFVQDSKIQVFHYPHKQGPLDYHQALKIQKTIESLEYAQLKQEILISVSDNSHLKIHNLLQKWNHQISLAIGQLLQVCLHDFVQNQFLKFEEFQEDKRLLNRFLKHLEQLQSISSEKPAVFYDCLKRTPRLKKCSEEHQTQYRVKIEQLYGFIDFFKHFDNQAFDVIKWREKIYRVKYFLQQLIEDPRFSEQSKRSNNQKYIQVRGFCCQSDQIQRIAQQAFKQPQSQSLQRRITVMSYFLNLNSNISVPGTDLIFITKFIRIPTEIQINLKGRDAIDYEQQEDINTDGSPGLPGENGGSLIIKNIHHNFDVKKIKVDIRGGRGGKGKNGGKIKIPIKDKYFKAFQNDVKKPTQDKQFMIERETYKFSDKNFVGKLAHIVRSIGTFNDQILEKYSTINYTKDPFLETIGGCNGQNGNMGKLQIGKIPYEIQLKKIINPNKSYGYKQIYEGVYLKEMVFASIRKQGRVAVKQEKQVEDLNQTRKKSRRQSFSDRKLPQKCNNNNKFLSGNSKDKCQISTQTSISGFALDPEKQGQQLFSEFKQEQDQKVRNFADSINNITDKFDFEQQLLVSLFKFNEDQQKRKKSIEIQNHQSNEVGFLKRKPINGHRQLYHSKNIELHKSKAEQSSKSQISIQPQQIGCQLQLTKPISQNTLPLLRSSTVNLAKSYSDFRSSENPEFHLNRAMTLPSNFSQKQLRKKYLQANIESLNKSELLELAKIRSQAQENIITSNIERQRFALMVSKELLNEFGKEIATDIGTEVIQTVGKDIVKNVSSQVVKNTSRQIGKEILIKGTEGLSKGYIGHQLGRQTLKQFSTSFSKSSIKQMGKKAGQSALSTVQFGGITETILGISKSFILQSIISAFLASGITDRWLIKPHFQSKINQSGKFNQTGLIKPPQKLNLSHIQIQKYWQEFNQLITYYQTKTLSYLCQNQLKK